jgi:hypothetical protein
VEKNDMRKLSVICFVIAALSTAVSAQAYWTKARQGALSSALNGAAYNSTWFSDCVRDAGGILKTVTAKSIVLAGPGSPRQFLLTGKIVPGHETCAYGAHSPMNWIVEENGWAFRVLADIGAVDGVRILRSAHNDYRDIGILTRRGPEGGLNTTIMKFDGSAYK